MQTKLSTKGQVVIPGPVRRRLGIRPGDPLDVNVEAGRIVLVPHKKRLPRMKIISDPITGLPVLSGGPETLVLSSREVAEILSDFP